MHHTDNLLTVAQVAEYLGMSRKWVYVEASAGTLPAFKVGNLWRFRLEEIDQWLESRR